MSRGRERATAVGAAGELAGCDQEKAPAELTTSEPYPGGSMKVAEALPKDIVEGRVHGR